MVQVIVFVGLVSWFISPIFTGCKQTTYYTYIIGVIADLVSTMDMPSSFLLPFVLETCWVGET